MQLETLGFITILLSGPVGGPVESICGSGSLVTYEYSIDPYEQIEPIYPRRAITRGTGGSVKLSFSVDDEGKPFDIHIAESHPKGMFEKGAISAIKKWRYKSSHSDVNVLFRYETKGTQKCYIEDGGDA